MAKINLLPWREALRKEKQTEFLITLGLFAALAAAVWGAVHWYHTEVIKYQESRIAYIESQIKVLDKKIEEIKRLEREKERLLSRMRAIERLQGNRPLVVRLFDEIINSLPEGVSLEKLAQNGRNITINGVAQSNARVSSFMRNLEKSEWLQNPDLDIIEVKPKEGPKISNFTLRFKQVIPTRDEEEGDEA
ncbi:MAG: PilN domain-containing protein [Thiotrichales bacterium]|nr:PilN domain-containing protein [Thiotrichales bacterium]